MALNNKIFSPIEWLFQLDPKIKKKLAMLHPTFH